MIVFVDTSAFYAVLDRDDANHAKAGEIWVRLLRDSARLLTNNYVLVETLALLQHRIGVAAVRAFQQDVMPVLEVDWVSEQRHRAGAEALLVASRKKLSLADCVSFQTMRAHATQQAFCFDAHFREQGFEVLP